MLLIACVTVDIFLCILVPFILHRLKQKHPYRYFVILKTFSITYKLLLMSVLLLPSILSLYEAPTLILRDSDIGCMLSVLTKYAASISLICAFVLFLKENTWKIVSHLRCTHKVFLLEQECLHTLNWNVFCVHVLPHCVINVLISVMILPYYFIYLYLIHFNLCIPLYACYHFCFYVLLLTSVAFETFLKPRSTRLDHSCRATLNQFLH